MARRRRGDQCPQGGPERLAFLGAALNAFENVCVRNGQAAMRWSTQGGPLLAFLDHALVDISTATFFYDGHRRQRGVQLHRG